MNREKDQKGHEDPFHVCFICSGNICRSPYAEGLLRHIAEQKGVADRLRVTSAGTYGIVDRPAHARMCEEAIACGFDLSEHRSQGILASHVADCDLILGLAKGHVTDLRATVPEFAGKIFLLGAYPSTTTDEGEIADPIGQGEAEFRACFDEIHEAIERLWQLLEEKL